MNQQKKPNPGLLPAWNSSTKLADDNKIVRVYKPNKGTFNPDASEPMFDMYKITEADIEEGVKRNLQPLLSTWDISIQQSSIIVNIPIKTTQEGFVYSLKVQDIHAIPDIDPKIPIEVHADPIKDPEKKEGEKHSGIQGLARPTGVDNKKVYEALKIKLVRISNFEYKIQ